MRDAEQEHLTLLARSVLVILVLLTVIGVFWYGVTFGTIDRIWTQLVDRPSGPMAFRFVLQPLMAIVAGVLHGRKDVRLDRSPYLWTLLWSRHHRMDRLREGLNATARVVLLGIVMDMVYEAVVLQRFYPVESVIVALVLGFVPYVLMRGIAARIIRLRHAAKPTQPT